MSGNTGGSYTDPKLLGDIFSKKPWLKQCLNKKKIRKNELRLQIKTGIDGIKNSAYWSLSGETTYRLTSWPMCDGIYFFDKNGTLLSYDRTYRIKKEPKVPFRFWNPDCYHFSSDWIVSKTIMDVLDDFESKGIFPYYMLLTNPIPFTLLYQKDVMLIQTPPYFSSLAVYFRQMLIEKITEDEKKHEKEVRISRVRNEMNVLIQKMEEGKFSEQYLLDALKRIKKE
jgi:hypothetical protein